MLNIGKMGPGSEDYYLSLTVDRAEDYYLRRGEAPGRWIGRGLEPLGLDGTVEANELRAVLAGNHPATGERLASHPARKVPGFDLTFRAPKSVSLAWAFADRDTADQVLAAHEAAVEAAVGYMERHAVRTRRGAGGVERVEVDGLVAGAFPHRTSRAGDPLLHTHVVCANLVRTTDDGKWRTLESRRLYLHAKTAGYLYQAHLRHELTARLGVAWRPVLNGYADIDGIDRELIEGFSQRRRQILDRLDERGESSAKAAQVATLETRTTKGEQPTEAELRTRWRDQARELGFDPDALSHVFGRHEVEAPDVAGLVRVLVHDEALTEQVSTFARRDLLQAVAERLPDGASVADVEALADAVVEAGREQLVELGPRRGHLTQVDSIRTADGRVIAADEDEARMTTRRLLLAEQHAINTAITRQGEGIGLVDEPTVASVLAGRPTMTLEQVRMLRRLVVDGDGVAVVVGRAGTGKTYTLDAARDAWNRAGISVHGVALAARAARELGDASAIPSTTIHRLLHQIERGPGSPLAPGSVLVVDEAGMVGTRQLCRLLTHAQQQHVKVVLVGDPRQLPEIDAGGLFGHLTRRLEAIQLVDNRRQAARWEIDALDRLRHGEPGDALYLYDSHDRLVTADTAEALRERLVSDWWHGHHQVGADRAAMIALRQADVDDLNQRARLRLAATDHLHGPTLEVDGREFRAGDRILCLRNDRRLWVVNGTFATIDAIQDRDLLVTDDHGRELRLPANYVDAGHVTHGYAITGHKAQGLTVDHAFVLGSDRLYREWGYVAMSRGRYTNRLYVHAAVADPHGVTHGRQPELDPHRQTVEGLRRSAAQMPAVAYLDPDTLDRLTDRYHELDRYLTAVDHRRGQLEQAIEELSEQRAWMVRSVEADQNARGRLGGMSQLRRGARQQARDLDRRLDASCQRLAAIDDQLDAARQQLSQAPSDQLGPLGAERTRISLQLHEVARQRIDAALRNPPTYLLSTIGTSPPEGPERQAWRRAANAVEHYRVTYQITDPRSPLGAPAGDRIQRAVRKDAADELLEFARLQQHNLDREPERPLQPVRSIRRGLSR